ncbi:MAG: hypothetical protein D6690_17140 [Nitrospirae bacterium]|nr:MAG: hypothetical protein D6690_17140 [Nitrospirota bacterium]
MIGRSRKVPHHAVDPICVWGSNQVVLIAPGHSIAYTEVLLRWAIDLMPVSSACESALRDVILSRRAEKSKKAGLRKDP